MNRLALPQSFRGKLLLLVLLTASASVVIQSAVLQIMDLLNVRPAALAQLSTEAGVIATHSVAALAFGDKAAGDETLAALDSAPKVLAARILDEDGNLFASYKRPGHFPVPDETPLQGHRFQGDRILFGRAIEHAGASLGTLEIVYDLSPYFRAIWHKVFVSLGIAALAVVLGMLAVLRLQRSLTEPVLELVRASRSISQTRDYALRVPRHRDDEIGHLTDSFNEMLETIEARDSELTKAQRALTASNDQLQQFAYVASHDLQEPLRKIQTFSSLLQEDHAAALPEEARDYLDRMDSAATRMRSLINDLLAFSRVSSREQKLVDLDLNEIVDGILSDLEVRIEETSASVQSGKLPTVRADELHLRQLFQNLIANALKFSRPGVAPVVRIAATLESPVRGEPQWKLTVADNGIGFEQHYAERIFMPFQRLHGRSEYEGTGIGLAVCRRIADRYGWGLSVTSQPGQGTTFQITFPAHTTETLQHQNWGQSALKGEAA